ncbi:MAG TPA: helicase C-terminal domain-containing protein [Fibrobacteraceae bacterium]|nr:helicase C-terminal domain-containing protein [Fibrobacteraceae bacterium]
MTLQNFIAIDLETTGLDNDKDEIIEVAFVRFVNGSATETFDCLVKPGQPVRPFIHTLTGIDPEELANAKPFAEIAQSIVEFIGQDPLVAHNASFDVRFLKQALEKAGLPLGLHPVFDTLLFSRIIWQKVANHRLETLLTVLDIPRETSHRAQPDARACGELFCLALAELERLSAFERQKIARLVRGTSWEILFPLEEGDEAPLQLLPASVPPSVDATRHPKRVHDFFAPQGFLEKHLPGFHSNPHQAQFAEMQERNLFKGGLAVLEAGTGSGKTLAYLVPSILKAVETGERVVISTATRALQEQLWQKDLPALAPLFGSALKPAIVKGRNNYLCLRKFMDHLSHADILLTPEEREGILPLVTWVEHTETGDANENSGFHVGRNRQLWMKLASDSSTCVGQSCPFFQRCFGLEARRRAQNANLVLINHALFLQDLALDFALLPPYEHIVFDEAHRLPQAAHEAFGKRIWFFRLRNQLKLLAHVKSPQNGILGDLTNWCATQNPPLTEIPPLFDPIRSQISESEKTLHRFFLKIGKNIKRFNEKDGLRYQGSLFMETQADSKPVLNALEALLSSLRNLCEILTSMNATTAFVRDLEGCIQEIDTFRKDFDFVTHAQREDWAFWMEEPGNPHTIVLYAQPLHPGKRLTEKFYPWIKSALFTSATLSVQGGLEYYLERMGMSDPSLPQTKRPFARILDLPFDVNAKRRILIADFLPKPNDSAFQKALDEVLCAVLPGLSVSSMVLFTSLASLGKSHEALSPIFSSQGKTLLSQHTDGAIDNLVEIFRKKKGACLIGAQMLWEGVDLPGDSLEFLVIPKLPFPTPGDALIQARGEEVKARGGNSFKDIFIPEAVLALRQGIGRLIRNKEDTGTVLLLDPRLVHENYGKSFTRLWGGKHEVMHNLDELREALQTISQK